MNSKPGTAERLQEMIDAGLLKEECPEEVVTTMAKGIADDVDTEMLKWVGQQTTSLNS